MDGNKFYHNIDKTFYEQCKNGNMIYIKYMMKNNMYYYLDYGLQGAAMGGHIEIV